MDLVDFEPELFVAVFLLVVFLAVVADDVVASSDFAFAGALLTEAALLVFAALAEEVERRVAVLAAATYALSQRSILASGRALGA